MELVAARPGRQQQVRVHQILKRRNGFGRVDAGHRGRGRRVEVGAGVAAQPAEHELPAHRKVLVRQAERRLDAAVAGPQLAEPVPGAGQPVAQIRQPSASTRRSRDT